MRGDLAPLRSNFGTMEGSGVWKLFAQRGALALSFILTLSFGLLMNNLQTEMWSNIKKQNFTGSSLVVDFRNEGIPLGGRGGYQVCSTDNRSDACKSLYGNESSFLEPRKRLTISEVTVDFRNHTYVIDLRCRHEFRYAYFHLWHNCILEMISLIRYADGLSKGVSIVILERDMKDILDKAGLLTETDLHVIDPSKRCALNIYCRKILYYDASSVSLQVRAQLLRHYFISKELRSSPRIDNILYLKRVGRGREIYPEQYLLGNISYIFSNHTLTTFYGNEGLENTIQMFWLHQS